MLVELVTSLLPSIIGSPRTINYSIRDTLKEVERIIGHSLPEAWSLWKTYESKTKVGNAELLTFQLFTPGKTFFYNQAQEAIMKLQAYLKKVLVDFEAEQKRKAAEEAMRQAAEAEIAAEVPDWGKYLPFALGIGILLLGSKKV